MLDGKHMNSSSKESSYGRSIKIERHQFCKSNISLKWLKENEQMRNTRATDEQELLQRMRNECATDKSKSYFKRPKSKKATYQVLGTFETWGVLGGVQRVEEDDLFQERIDTNKHPMFLKYYRKEHMHSMML